MKWNQVLKENKDEDVDAFIKKKMKEFKERDPRHLEILYKSKRLDKNTLQKLLRSNFNLDNEQLDKLCSRSGVYK